MTAWILLFSVAQALTLEEAVRRAAEVDPDALVAENAAAIARLQSADVWLDRGVTVRADLDVGTTFGPDGTLTASTGALDPAAWFDATQAANEARGARHVATATRLDAQYAAAYLYHSALAAEAGVAAAERTDAYARATAKATAARVAAGLVSEILGRSAEIGVLLAEGRLARARADLAIARARLSRALQQEIDALAPAPAVTLSDAPLLSPWLDAADADVAAARAGRSEAVAALFPAGTAWISAPFADEGVWSAPAPWAAGLGLSWTLDGLAGPFLRLRQAAVGVDSAEVSRDGLERDLRLGIAVAREAAAASATVAAAARAREAVAEEALQIGYARLDVGLGNPLEILRLQDEAAQARAERVTAELDAALAALEARRLAGVPW